MKNIEKKLKGFTDSGNTPMGLKISKVTDIRDNTGFCKPAIVFLFLSKSRWKFQEEAYNENYS